MEKEQLFQLGVYLRDYVASLSAEEKSRESAPQEPGWPGGETTLDFKAGQMFLSHDKQSNSFYMQAHEREMDDEGRERPPRRSRVGQLLDDHDPSHRTGRRIPAHLRRRPPDLLPMRAAHQPRRPRMPEGQRAYHPRSRLTAASLRTGRAV